MWNQKRFHIVLAAAVVALPMLAQAAPTLTVKSRSKNTLPTEYQLGVPSSGSTDPYRFNLRDCEDGVTLTVTANASNMGDNELYFFVGKECSTGDNCESTAEQVDAGSSKKFTVKELTDECSGEGSTQIWLGLIKSLDDKTTGAEWATPIKIEWDMTPPSPPTNVEALGGNEKVSVTWTSADGEDEADEEETQTDDTSDESDGSGSRYYVVYWKVGDALDTTQESSVDSETEPSTETQIATSTVSVVDTATTADTESEMSSETQNSSVTERTTDTVDTQFSDATDSATDSLSSPVPRSADVTCSDGGFARGDEFDPEAGYGVKSNMSSGSSVGGLENGATYKVAVVARDEFYNFSVLSAVDCAVPEKTSGFFDAFGNDGGSVNGKLCFVATVAFGSQDHPTVESLRTFRDEFLLRVPLGRAFVEAYYTVGPFVAIGLAHHPSLLSFVRGLLLLLSLIGSALVFLGPLGSAAALGLGLCGVGFTLRRRASTRRPS